MMINKELNKKLIATLALSLFISGCSDSLDSEAGKDFNTGITDSNNNSEFNEQALLTGLTSQVIVPAINQFEDSANALNSAIDNHCAAIETDTNVEAALDAARASWRETMNVWQQIEVMQMGPLSDNDASLRNAIYSWPVVRHCAVDQDVGHFELGEVSGKEYDISKRTSDRKGLAALEYLLFNDDVNHSCSSDTLAPSGWNDRSVLERTKARCAFASEVATDLHNSAVALKDGWENETSGFVIQLTQAGTDNSDFENTHSALNKITDAMFYLDSITKDAKLAAPIGLNPNSCGTATCLNDVESTLSNHAIQNVKFNLVALQSLFLGAPIGNEAIGFDDYLIDVDASELATTMATDIEAAISAADEFEGTMSNAVSNEPAKVQALHSAVKKVTDNLKSLFITYLSLELPLTSAGDAD